MLIALLIAMFTASVLIAAASSHRAEAWKITGLVGAYGGLLSTYLLAMLAGLGPLKVTRPLLGLVAAAVVGITAAWTATAVLTGGLLRRGYASLRHPRPAPVRPTRPPPPMED
jgi:hypothetical protein